MRFSVAVASLGVLVATISGASAGMSETQRRITICDINVESLIAKHSGDPKAEKWDEDYLKREVKKCLSDLSEYLYATYTAHRLKDAGVNLD